MDGEQLNLESRRSSLAYQLSLSDAPRHGPVSNMLLPAFVTALARAPRAAQPNALPLNTLSQWLPPSRARQCALGDVGQARQKNSL
jgi:hypothetical protein